MRNLTDPRMLWLKGSLFVLLGLLASVLLIVQLPDIRYAALLALAIWSFCCAYYFAFYVIEHYVDSRTGLTRAGEVCERYTDGKYAGGKLTFRAGAVKIGWSAGGDDSGWIYYESEKLRVQTASAEPLC